MDVEYRIMFNDTDLADAEIQPIVKEISRLVDEITVIQNKKKYKQTTLFGDDPYADLVKELDKSSAKYRGLTVRQISDMFNHFPIDKGFGQRAIACMLGQQGKCYKQMTKFQQIVEDGTLYKITMKSVVVHPNGTNTEDVKLYTPKISAIRHPKKCYEDSYLCRYLTHRIFLVGVFQEPYVDCELDECVFLGFRLLHLNESQLQTYGSMCFYRVKEIFENDKFKEIVFVDAKGCPIFNANGVARVTVNLPKKTDGIVFMRGTGSGDSSHKVWVIKGIRMYPHQIWIDGAWFVKNLALDKEFLLFE